MEAQQCRHLPFISAWIFVFFFPSVCSGMGSPKIHLESTVFVAAAGEELDIKCNLMIPANQSSDIMVCYNPSGAQIYSCDVPATGGQPKNMALTLHVKNLSSSGVYFCQYKTARAYWFLRLRREDYRERTVDYTEIIAVAVFTSVLLVFSVVGSVCVFRGHLKQCGDTGKKQKQKREERKERAEGEDNVHVITSPSTSFYASLEPRPRSIYDVLDRSAANREPDQSKAKPKKEEAQKTMAQTIKDQQEAVFESVYENF